MSAHMKKLHTKQHNNIICIHHAGDVYQFPKEIAEKYRVPTNHSVSADKVFSALNKEYTKPGALLRGIRVRENLTQIEMAQKLNVTQSDISQMERGIRNIGRVIAQRIEKIFDVDYQSFLE